MTKEEQFEQHLNSLILLKALLVRDDEFDEVAQYEYNKGLDRAFELLKQYLLNKNIIKKDMVAAMPLGFSVAIATPFLCGFLIFLLYNKIAKS